MFLSLIQPKLFANYLKIFRSFSYVLDFILLQKALPESLASSALVFCSLCQVHSCHPGSSFTIINPGVLCASLLYRCSHSPWTPFFLTYCLVLEEHFLQQLPKQVCPGGQYEKTFHCPPLLSLVIWLEIISFTTLNPLFRHIPEPNMAFEKTKTIPISDYNLLPTSCPSL